MATHTIRKGESLALEYSVEGVNDLTGYLCEVQIQGVTVAGQSVAEMQLSPDKRYFRGNIISADTEGLTAKMYHLVAKISNVTEANDTEERRFQINDKLIVEPSILTPYPSVV